MTEFLLLIGVKLSIVTGIILSLQRIMPRKKNINTYIAFFLFFGTSIVLWGIWVTGSGLARAYPRSTFLYVPALLAIGPLYFFYYYLLLKPEEAAFVRVNLHLMPASVSLVIDIITLFFPVDFRHMMINTLLDRRSAHFLTPIIILSCFHMLSYFFYLLIVGIRLYPKLKEQLVFLKIGIFANSTAIAALSLILAGFLSSNNLLYYAGGCAIGGIHFSLLMLSVRFPHFFQILAKEIRRSGYEKSLLGALDVDGTLKSLSDYMRSEKPFLLERISVRDVAEKIGISQGQLSQLLNDRMSIDFRNFVNQYRIEEAMKKFMEDPEANILSVGYQVGFNSKSSFNESFKKFTGKTPSEFKTDQAGKK